MRVEQGVKVYSGHSRKLPTDCYFVQQIGGYMLPYKVKKQQLSGDYLTVAAVVDEYTAIKIAKLLNQDNGDQDG